MGEISRRIIEMMETEVKMDKLYHYEFEKTLKTLDEIFLKNRWTKPRDWKEVYEWHYAKYKNEHNFKKANIKDKGVYLEWAEANNEFYKEEISLKEPEKVEIYNNLPHALCILDDLGILDLIEEKFSNKNYSGKAREKDKATLIATILKIDNGEKVRLALKNKDYLSKTAKKNAKKTLNDLGLPSSFNDD